LSRLGCGKTYFGVFLGAVLIVVLIETQYRRHSAWLILTSAASLVAILNAVVLGTGLTALASALGGGFRGWDVAAGLAGTALSYWLMLGFESRALDESV
jgi:hypothetical protein